MKPVYIRFVLPPNKGPEPNNTLHNATCLRSPQLLTFSQNNLPSLQLLNGIPSITTINQSRVTNDTLPSTFNSSQKIIQQKINKSTTVPPIPQSSNSVLSSADTSTVQPKDIEIIPKIDISPKQLKRRIWSENDTITFINLWIEYYPSLTNPGSRHAPIYQAMANDLNQTFKSNDLTGGDVKCKIGNLTTEYRRKKKDMGRTGGSPSPWPYFELIDKLLGERPYMNNSLLSESIVVEEEAMEEKNEAPPDLNSTQVSKQVDDLVPLTTSSDNINNRDSVNSIVSPSLTTTASIPNSDSPVQAISKTKKNIPSKRKRVSEVKLDLMKDLFGKIESATDAAAQSEIKILELLQKQTHLQEQSVANEREFLNVFKTLMDNMT